MHHDEKKPHAAMGMHVGSASIVMIFSVLCLTVFSSLAFITASNEYKLAQKTMQVAEQYYVADGICEERYIQICSILQNVEQYDKMAQQLAAIDVQTERREKDWILSYTVPIDALQQMYVQLCLREDRVLLIEQWAVEASEPWEYDTAIKVWDGQ